MSTKIENIILEDIRCKFKMARTLQISCFLCDKQKNILSSNVEGSWYRYQKCTYIEKKLLCFFYVPRPINKSKCAGPFFLVCYAHLWRKQRDTGLELVRNLKGSVKWKKRGGASGINRWALYSSTFPQIFYCFLKNPGPLNKKKRISAV